MLIRATPMASGVDPCGVAVCRPTTKASVSPQPAVMALSERPTSPELSHRYIETAHRKVRSTVRVGLADPGQRGLYCEPLLC